MLKNIVIHVCLSRNHRYNYDPDYTSGESSIDDFIDDDEDPGSNASSSSEVGHLIQRCYVPNGYI